MHLRRDGAICLAIPLALLATPALAIGPAPTWQPRQIVASGLPAFPLSADHVGADRILAYDHFGDPGIIFDGGSNARYARYVPGVGWQSVVADGAGTGGFPSLAFDRREHPSFVSASGSPGPNGPKFTSFGNGSTFSGQNLPDTFAVDYTSLAYDSTGAPAIAYQRIVSGELRYFKDTNGNGLLTDETSVLVDAGPGKGAYATLAFDKLDRPMIVSQDTTNFDLRFSVFDTGVGWINTAVDSAGSTGYWPSLAIDPKTGFPAIAYYNGDTADLLYAAWNGTSWTITTIDSTGDVGRYPSLAFDPADGNPAIAYLDQSGNHLKLAWFNGTSWQTQPVDTGGAVGYFPSLAFNDFGTGFPAIAYFDAAASTLYFIEDPPAAVPEPASFLLLALGGLFGVAVRRSHGARRTPR